MNSKSAEAFAKSKLVFPGGVNSPVRAFGNVGLDPFFVERGEDAFLFDIDQNRYIDFVLSWGPLVLGHADTRVVSAIAEQAAKGTTYGACCELEYTLAKAIQAHFPSLEMLRFVNSGTEAGMAVVRLARAFTGRSKLIKFAGCYHGHLDALLVQAGSGASTFSVPNSAGVSEELVRDTLIAEYNNLEAVEALLQNNIDKVAAILVEPVAGNMGFIRPRPDFLHGLRELADRYSCLLIFDEVMTGFRVALGGMQSIVSVTPDLTMLGKVIGGGLPVGAFGGRAEIMSLLAPLGAVYQAGTLSGNPLAMAAGIKTLQIWQEEFSIAESAAQLVVKQFKSCANDFNIPLQADSLGTMFGFFFNSHAVSNYTDAKKCDLQRYSKFFKLALQEGLYFAPSQFEAGFVSSKHKSEVMQSTSMALKRIFSQLA